MSKARMLGMAAKMPLKKEKPRAMGWHPARGSYGKKQRGSFSCSIALKTAAVKKGEKTK